MAREQFSDLGSRFRGVEDSAESLKPERIEVDLPVEELLKDRVLDFDEGASYFGVAVEKA